MRPADQITGCVKSTGTEFQMELAQKWLKPGPQNFLQLFTKVFGSCFENLKNLALKNLHI